MMERTSYDEGCQTPGGGWPARNLPIKSQRPRQHHQCYSGSYIFQASGFWMTLWNMGKISMVEAGFTVQFLPEHHLEIMA